LYFEGYSNRSRNTASYSNRNANNNATFTIQIKVIGRDDLHLSYGFGFRMWPLMSARMSSVVLGIATILAIYRKSVDESNLDFCSPPITPVEELVSMPSFLEEKDLELVDRSMQGGMLGKGGSYIPTDCQPTSRIAILIPYRNRSSHLAHFLEIMHPILQRQRLQYTIVVVNQTGEDPFLRGLMLNVGFLEALSHLPFRPDCFFLHDVDHIPERQGMVYQCSQAGVVQFANAIDRYDYELRRDRERIIPYGTKKKYCIIHNNPLI